MIVSDGKAWDQQRNNDRDKPHIPSKSRRRRDGGDT